MSGTTLAIAGLVLWNIALTVYVVMLARREPKIGPIGPDGVQGPPGAQGMAGEPGPGCTGPCCVIEPAPVRDAKGRFVKRT